MIEYIDLYSKESLRASCLECGLIGGRRVLKVVGNLPHGYIFEPKDIRSANKLREWLGTWTVCRAWEDQDEPSR